MSSYHRPPVFAVGFLVLFAPTRFSLALGTLLLSAVLSSLPLDSLALAAARLSPNMRRPDAAGYMSSASFPAAITEKTTLFHQQERTALFFLAGKFILNMHERVHATRGVGVPNSRNLFLVRESISTKTLDSRIDVGQVVEQHQQRKQLNNTNTSSTRTSNNNINNNNA